MTFLCVGPIVCSRARRLMAPAAETVEKLRRYVTPAALAEP